MTTAVTEGMDGRQTLRQARTLVAEGRPAEARQAATSVVDVSDDLSTWSGAAAVLRTVLPEAPLPRSARVAVLGSSTTSQLAALLPLACARAGLQVEVYEAPYGQYQQEILDPGSRLYAFDPDAVVLALHEGDIELPLLSDAPHDDVAAAVGRLQMLWRVLGERSRATVVQFTMAVPPEQPLGHLGLAVPGSRHRMLVELNLRLAEAAAPTVALVDCERLASSVGTRTWFDARYWHLAKQAVSPACIPLLARHTGAVIAAGAGLSRKCLVLDLDNTLWGGVLGEDGLEGLRLGEGPEGEAFSAFQRYVLALKAKGVILAICSKNDEPLVTDAFARHPAMLLSLDDVAVVSAGWDDKPAQLRRIADDLGISLDSLVLADDNPVEREAVRQLVPQVDVLRLPQDPAGYVRALADYPYFETTRLTAEDSARTEQYRARASAASALAGASSLDDFLDSLDMEARIGPVSDADLPRVTQLVGKTNQFNVTSRRRSQAELEQLVADPAVVSLSARLSDRFADHGLVAVLLARHQGSELHVDSWLMSCRVIGRTLEQAMLGVLLERAADLGCTSVHATYLPTAKNGLVADLFARLGFEQEAAEPDGTTRWRVTTAGFTAPAWHLRIRDTAPAVGKE